MTDVELPQISVIIPVHNEATILRSAVLELRAAMQALGRDYEIILAENGSIDRTLEIAHELVGELPEVRFLSTPTPNYGAALKAGLLAARGQILICDEIDLCDARFHEAAVRLLEQAQADVVIGSKLLHESQDRRPLFRHLASLVYSGILRLLLGFRGTDTHGPKALLCARTRSIVEACVVDKDVFASELVLRAHRAGLRVREVPLNVREKRPPSINLWKRVPAVIRNLIRLHRALRTTSNDFPASSRGERRQ